MQMMLEEQEEEEGGKEGRKEEQGEERNKTTKSESGHGRAAERIAHVARRSPHLARCIRVLSHSTSNTRHTATHCSLQTHHATQAQRNASATPLSHIPSNRQNEWRRAGQEGMELDDGRTDSQPASQPE